jgi:hypothetical protein
MTIVMEPPEWRQRKGFRRNLSNAGLALWSASRQSGERVFGEAVRHWRIELLLAVGYVITVLVGLDTPGTRKLSLLLAAILPPLVIAAVALLVSFIALVVSAPFLDHRKLVWERDREHGAREIENKQHWAERARLELQLGLRQVEGVPQRLEQLREAEAIADERARQRATGERSPFAQLMEWAQTVGVALSNGGFSESVEQFSNPFQGKTTADQLEATYHRLREIVDSVIKGEIQP